MDKNVNSDCIDSCGHDAASYLQISARVPSIVLKTNPPPHYKARTASNDCPLLIKLQAINIGIREHIVYFVDIYILQP